MSKVERLRRRLILPKLSVANTKEHSQARNAGNVISHYAMCLCRKQYNFSRKTTCTTTVTESKAASCETNFVIVNRPEEIENRIFRPPTFRTADWFER